MPINYARNSIDEVALMKGTAKGFFDKDKKCWRKASLDIVRKFEDSFVEEDESRRKSNVISTED